MESHEKNWRHKSDLFSYPKFSVLSEIRVLLCIRAWSFYSSFVKKQGKKREEV